MPKIKKRDGFLGCRTTQNIETSIKALSREHNRDVSEVINYLCRLFIEDENAIRSKFFGIATGEKSARG